MSLLRTKQLAVASALAIQIVHADLSIFCTSEQFPDSPPRITSFLEYEQCADICQCYAFELLCVERVQIPDGSFAFTLESSDYDSVQACSQDNTCICNYQEDSVWSTTASLNNGVPLPAPIEVDLPTFEILKARAESGSDTREYEKDLFNELGSSNTRADHVVIHPMNEAFYGPLPALNKSQSVPTIDANCTDLISCDLYYELDWSVRLRQEMQCAEVLALNPCFATNACVCDTGYFQIAETMPEPPAADEEKADDQVIDVTTLVEAEAALEEEKKAEEEAAQNDQTSEADGNEAGQAEGEPVEQNQDEETTVVQENVNVEDKTQPNDEGEQNQQEDQTVTETPQEESQTPAEENIDTAEEETNSTETPQDEQVTQVNNESDDSGMSAGLIVLIVVLVVLVLVAVGVFFFFKYKRSKLNKFQLHPGTIEENQGSDGKGKRTDTEMAQLSTKKGLAGPPIAPTDDEKSAIEIANISRTNVEVTDAKALESTDAIKTRHAMNTMDSGVASDGGNNMAFPAIQQSKGQMQHTMTRFMDHK